MGGRGSCRAACRVRCGCLEQQRADKVSKGSDADEHMPQQRRGLAVLAAVISGASLRFSRQSHLRGLLEPLVELRVDATRWQQLGVLPTLHNPAVIEHQDEIRFADGAHPVSNNEACTAVQ